MNDGNLKTAILLICILMTGCVSSHQVIQTAQVSTLTPPPSSRVDYIKSENLNQPDFVSEPRVVTVFHGIETDRLVCVTIIHKPLWNEGDFAGTIDRAIESSIFFWIDGNPSSPESSSILSEIVRQGDNGEILGSFGAIDVCSSVKHLFTGEHSAKIEFKNTKNKLFSYEWIFEIVE